MRFGTIIDFVVFLGKSWLIGFGKIAVFSSIFIASCSSKTFGETGTVLFSITYVIFFLYPYELSLSKSYKAANFYYLVKC